MKKLQGFMSILIKTLQIKSYFLFFCLDTKEAKNHRLILLGDPLTSQRLTELMSRFA
jgi:hypothetical protein